MVVFGVDKIILKEITVLPDLAVYQYKWLTVLNWPQ